MDDRLGQHDPVIVYGPPYYPYPPIYYVYVTLRLPPHLRLNLLPSQKRIPKHKQRT
jgi:hypothetical protein